MTILILNGPNLNMLGKRDPTIYGSETLPDIEHYIQETFPEYTFEFFQSNVEGELVDQIQQSTQRNIDGIVANFGAYTHTSIALRDALEHVSIPKVEVHISNIHAREEFRKESLTGEVMNGIITGFGRESYILGIKAVELITN